MIRRGTTDMTAPRRPAWAQTLIPATIVGIVVALVGVGASAIALAAAMVAMIREPSPVGIGWALFALLAFAASFAAVIGLRGGYDRLMSPLFWHRYYRVRGECPFCGYPTRKIDSGRCPECGREIRP